MRMCEGAALQINEISPHAGPRNTGMPPSDSGVLQGNTRPAGLGYTCCLLYQYPSDWRAVCLQVLLHDMTSKPAEGRQCGRGLGAHLLRESWVWYYCTVNSPEVWTQFKPAVRAHS